MGTSQHPEVHKGHSGELKVLLVDDVPENLELLQDVLSENGYVAILAKNGAEALERLKNDTVHLIVADAMMPKMDGFQLCKEVRADPAKANVPFIIYTGNYVDGEDQAFARSIGVDRYVVKYAGLGSLIQAVDELATQRYGHRTEQQASTSGHIDDHAFLEQHHAIVIRKLEEKMAELEMYAETLVRKNREIQSSEDRYRGLFDHASVAIFVLDRVHGKVLDANRQGIALLHYTKEELMAMPNLPFVDGSEVTSSFLETSNFSSVETSIRTKEGEAIEVEVGVGPVARPQDTRVLLFVHDFTERKKMRDQLMQAEKMTLMGRLAAGIAHEIRNPLSAITLNLQYVLQKIGDPSPYRQTIEDALEGSRRVEAVIENTLSLARITPPVLKLEDVNRIVNQVLGFLKISVQQKSIKIKSFLAEPLPPISADAKQIQQVVLNVLQNAVDASHEDSMVSVTTGVLGDLPGGSDGEKVVVTIRDHGIGMTPEQYKHLFEQFHTTKPGGTGLGLVLSKHIMDKHHAEIRIDPAAGGGTIVRLIFPILH